METQDKIVVVSGGFDPLHSGHIALIDNARTIGRVIIALNSDEWLVRKKGRAFLSFGERYKILSSLRNVMCVIAFDDSDDSARDALVKAKSFFPHSQICFANGGDRTSDNIPEMDVEDVEFLFGIGGQSKANSSSWILNAWTNNQTDRPWGHYEVLKHFEKDGAKVKTLVVEAGKSLSMQRHKYRDELWFVVSGVGYVNIDDVDYDLNPESITLIQKGRWHQLRAIEDMQIIEIQTGAICEESDIERR